MRANITDVDKIWEAYETQVNSGEEVVYEFLSKIKSPFAKPDGPTAPATAAGTPAAGAPGEAPALTQPADQLARAPGDGGDQPVTPGDPAQQQPQDPKLNDGKLTLGDLKKTVELIQTGMKKEELKARAKGIGGDVFNLITTLAPIPNVLDFAITAKDVGEGLLGIIKGVSNPASPMKLNQNPIMKALQVDPELSSILDDQIENDFLAGELNKLLAQAETNPDTEIPNVTEMLRDFLNQKYLNQSSSSLAGQ